MKAATVLGLGTVAGSVDSPTDTDPAQVQRPRRGRPPLGHTARWRILFDAMANLKIGDHIRYEEMGDLLGLDFLDPRGAQLIRANARKAADELLRQRRTVARLVRGHGYQIAEPGQVIDLAHRHQARAVAEVRAGAEKVEAIDLSTVDVTTARLIEATAMGFARQEAIMRHLDIRQDRLEAAMTAVVLTAQTAITRAEETSTRIDATQTDLQQLDRRIAQLEANQPNGTSPHEPRPP